MAYSYAAFEDEATDAARLAMLRKHIAEVEAESAPNVSKDGTSVDRSVIESKLARLTARRVELESRVIRSRGAAFARNA
jgi:hypothetical protein